MCDAPSGGDAAVWAKYGAVQMSSVCDPAGVYVSLYSKKGLNVNTYYTVEFEPSCEYSEYVFPM